MIYAPRDWFASTAPVHEQILIEIIEEPVSEPVTIAEEAPVAEEQPPPEEEDWPEDPPPPLAAMLPPVDPRRVDPNPNPTPDTPYTPNTSLVEAPTVRSDVPVETDEQRRRRMAVMLNPTRVAANGFQVVGPGPSRIGAPAGWQNAPPGPTEQEIERRHNGFLREAAAERPWLEQRELDLRPQPDGSFVYTGHRFVARIRPDGEVVFDDADAVQTNGFSSSGTWDLSDAIMGGAGQDPHRAEREWFMRRTEELRMRIETEYRRDEMSRALGGLRGRLVRVWTTENRTAAARRRRIFDLWDDSEEDTNGARARAIIVDFIRETLPEGGEDAFTESELAQLNANRASETRFDPY